jgi:hypothetical protein
MKRVRKASPRISAVAIAVALAVTASVAFAQGKKPPGGETAVNNLSYPAVELGGAASPASAFFTVTTPELGKTFSYGCPDPAVDAEYPNFSCVSADGKTFYTAEQCMGTGMPCAGVQVDRIYWQKTTANDWSSDTIDGGLTYEATHIDWGDNLESQTWWSTAAIRVETTTFGFGQASPLQRGIQMWHVYGQGQTEMWGARADEEASLPYVYDATYAILHTMNARLNIAKMTTPEACPTTPSTGPYLPQGNWTYTPSGGYWQQALFTLYDVPYSPELNIGGKYVHGFNWQLRRDTVPTSVGKTGWWRLTFYSRNLGTSPAVTFPSPVENIVLDAPESVPAYPSLLGLTAAEAESGPLYRPVVIGEPDHLSYIDICIADSKGGGGKKGGGKP